MLVKSAAFFFFSSPKLSREKYTGPPFFQGNLKISGYLIKKESLSSKSLFLFHFPTFI